MGQKLPKAKDIKKGLFACGECGAKIPFDPAKSLRVGKCPKCGEQVLYPKIVSGLFLYSPLGSGGMGSVYKAVDLSGKKEYAVKLLSRNSKGDKDLINTLMREGEAGVSFGRHPNLIPVFAAGEDGEEYFIASEFVHGDRLDVLIERGHAGKQGGRDSLADTQCGSLYLQMRLSLSRPQA